MSQPRGLYESADAAIADLVANPYRFLARAWALNSEPDLGLAERAAEQLRHLQPLSLSNFEFVGLLGKAGLGQVLRAWNLSTAEAGLLQFCSGAMANTGNIAMVQDAINQQLAEAPFDLAGRMALALLRDTGFRQFSERILAYQGGSFAQPNDAQRMHARWAQTMRRLEEFAIRASVVLAGPATEMVMP